MTPHEKERGKKKQSKKEETWLSKNRQMPEGTKKKNGMYRKSLLRRTNKIKTAEETPLHLRLLLPGNKGKDLCTVI